MMICMIVIFIFVQALALLADYVDKEDPAIRIGAIMGLGITYANTQNEQVCNVCIWILSEFVILLLER